LKRRTFILTSVAAALPSRAMTQTALRPGQLLITGFRGTKPEDAEVRTVCKMLAEGVCGGVILLRRNCVSPEQIARLSQTFREASGDLVPIISIDQEGGRVARLDASNGFLDWMPALGVAVSGMSEVETEAYWTVRARQMADVGINLNYAPVVDLDLNADNPIIGRLGRAFGNEPGPVSRLATIFVRAHRAAGIKTSLKHFPGHGSSSTDSHKDTADISRSWKDIELDPFKAMIGANSVDSIMNGHLIHPDFSDEPWLPASLSWLSVKAIRQTLGFQGVIFTDDMQMAAIENLMPSDAAAVAAINAGNTFLIYSNYRRSDRIDTVAQIAAALINSMDQMSPPEIERQIAMASQFRSSLA
jgi:beta-N-acetylhexosaminidase